MSRKGQTTPFPKALANEPSWSVQTARERPGPSERRYDPDGLISLRLSCRAHQDGARSNGEVGWWWATDCCCGETRSGCASERTALRSIVNAVRSATKTSTAASGGVRTLKR